MSLEVKIVGMYPIEDLVKRHACCNKLQKIRLNRSEKIKWSLEGDAIYDMQVIFIGKTGYGKSTTINKIVGERVLETSDIKACTKDMYSIEYMLSGDNNFFSLNDLPGIGESVEADKAYCVWYQEMLKRSCCVVYVLRADQRDFSLDEVLFKEMFKLAEEREKVILALNFADKVEPANRNSKLTQEQTHNLQVKIRMLKDLFKFNNIIYYSAESDVNLDVLINKIVEVSLEQICKL